MAFLHSFGVMQKNLLFGIAAELCCAEKFSILLDEPWGSNEKQTAQLYLTEKAKLDTGKAN